MKLKSLNYIISKLACKELTFSCDLSGAPMTTKSKFESRESESWTLKLKLGFKERELRFGGSIGNPKPPLMKME